MERKDQEVQRPREGGRPTDPGKGWLEDGETEVDRGTDSSGRKE